MTMPEESSTRGMSTEDLLAATAAPERPRTEAGGGGSDGQALLTAAEAARFRQSWQAIQTDFVDDPQQAVRDADELVAATIRSLAATFADYRRELETQWNEGGAATEELRVVLQRYRSFFDQLLSQ